MLTTVILAGLLGVQFTAFAQFKDRKAVQEQPETEAEMLLKKAESAQEPVVITLEQALEIALSENVAVKVADLEIKRTEYAKKGAYAALYPQIDLSAAYQRTIKRQVMYMDVDSKSMAAMMGGSSSTELAQIMQALQTLHPEAFPVTPSAPETESAQTQSSSASAGGIEVGRLNTLNGGVTVAMPLINAQLWKGLKISGMDVELAVEKARASRLDMVSQVKSAFFGTLFAKEALNVYQQVYNNAVSNFEETQKKFDAQKVSELELLRSKTNVASSVTNLYNAESTVVLALWQLKAVLGVDLDMNIDVAGKLEDFSQQMFYDVHQHDSINVGSNSTMKQLAIQTEVLAENIKLQKYANIPSLAVAFNFSMNTMANDVSFSEFKWTPYSYVGLSLNIPIFAGGKRHFAIRQAQNQYNQVKMQVDNTERQLKIAIRQQLTTMETNMKSYYAAQETTAMAQKAYDIAEAAYKVGRSTQLELNDAQLALTQSQLAQYQAVYNFLNAKTQLEQTLGQDFVK